MIDFVLFLSAWEESCYFLTDIQCKGNGSSHYTEQNRTEYFTTVTILKHPVSS